MKNRCKAGVLFLALAVIAAESSATEWHVYSTEVNGMTGNQQLTNAFAQAKSEDTITIHAGTYNLATEELMFRYETDANGTVHASDGTCLVSAVDNLTVRGDPSVSRDAIILSGQGDKLTGEGKHAIMRLSGQNCRVEHLKFYRGKANSNYIVYKNGVGASDRWIYRRGGGLNITKTSICFDCAFESCYAGQGASIYGCAEVRECEFLNDNAVEKNAGCSVCEATSIFDSKFKGGSRGSVRGCTGVLSNCVFIANKHNRKESTEQVGLLYYHKGSIIDCAFSNNTTVCIFFHGANYMPKEIRGCTFAYNSDAIFSTSAGIGGPVACTKPVFNCTFIGPNQINNFEQEISDCRFIRESKSNVTVLSGCPKVYRSEFYGTIPVSDKILEATANTYVSVVSNCSLYSCHIHDFNIRYGNVLTDVKRMENCLVHKTVLWGRNLSEMLAGGEAPSGTFRFTRNDDVDIVNCTFTTNQSNSAYINQGGCVVRFKNTLFFNNLAGSVREWGYADFDEDSAATVRMDSCVYKCSKDLPGESSYNWYENSNKKPKFLKDVFPDEEHEHPYALHRRSPCINAGVNGTWTAQDRDLAGNKRVNDIVDIGCYENWDKIPGMTLLVR